MSTGIARAREELFAAHLLATTGFAAQSRGAVRSGPRWPPPRRR